MINFNKRVILASASPRRQELIKLIFDNTEVLPAQCDETLPQDIGAREAVEYLSNIKNQATLNEVKGDCLIISADTVVAVNDEILGKPVDKDDARRMISLLSGRIHQVYTGVTISYKGKVKTFSEKTDVEFFPLTEEETEEYISTSEPYDKAGSYGIQGKAGLLIKGINGDYYNVVGLPVARLKRELQEFLKQFGN